MEIKTPQHLNRDSIKTIEYSKKERKLTVLILPTTGHMVYVSMTLNFATKLERKGPLNFTLGNFKYMPKTLRGPDLPSLLLSAIYLENEPKKTTRTECLYKQLNIVSYFLLRKSFSRRKL